MSDHAKRPQDELGRLVGRLPKDVDPPSDLWSRIAAELERPSLDSVVRAVRTEMEPPVDLWPEIETRIRRGRARLGLVAAAIVVLAAPALWLAIGPWNDRLDTPPDAATVDLAPPAADVVHPWLEQLAAAQADVARTFRESLALVREQRALIERAIEQHPNDPNLRDLWAYAYVTEVRLESEIGGVLVNSQRGQGI